MRYLQHGVLPDVLIAHRRQFHIALSHALSLYRRGLRQKPHPTTARQMQSGAHNMHALDIPPSQNLSARVEHILVDEPGTLSKIISKALILPQEFAKELIRFGAVHWCAVLPARADSVHASDPQQAQHASEARAAAIAILGTRPEHSQPKRASEDVPVTRHSYIRVHVHPKRFPAAYIVDWKERLVHVTPSYVVVNKPPGVPVVPPVDNILESCLAFTAQALCEAAPLLSVHRLDACTEGLVVLGRTRAFVAAFNRAMLEPNRVRKQYKALTAAQPPLGALVHHVTVGVRRKGLPTYTEVHEGQIEGSVRCDLDVLRAERVAVGPAARALGWPEHAWESLLRLGTGRTHQIRAQFAAVGAPLLGDTLYEPLSRGQQPQGEKEVLPEGRDRVLNEPLSAGIGLQACMLTVVDGEDLMEGRTEFEAPLPWWHS